MLSAKDIELKKKRSLHHNLRLSDPLLLKQEFEISHNNWSDELRADLPSYKINGNKNISEVLMRTKQEIKTGKHDR